MKATLFVIPGSHPSIAAELMLERRGIGYRRVDLIPVVSKLVLKAQRFPGVTVPALKLDGRRLQGTRAIAEELDRLDPSAPPLVPTGSERRDELERWADDQLQTDARRLIWWCLRRDRAPMASYSEGAKLGLPVGLAVKTGQPIVALSAHFNNAGDEETQAAVRRLPAALDRVDAALAEGTIGGAEPTLADYQVATCVRLLTTFDDLRPLIEGRPAGEHAMRLVPDYPGRVPAGAVPAEWLAEAGPTAQRTS